MKPLVVKSFRYGIVLIIFGVIALLLPRLLTSIYAHPLTYKIDSSPTKPVAIVFGAGLWRDGSPTPVLRERINTAAELYFSGKVHKLLMSGDYRYWNYNEPAAMGTYALSLGVPDSAIILDYAGRRTYDTCYRAGEIFGVEQAILVTQNYHLSRALYLCNSLGVTSIGVPAHLPSYSQNRLLYWNMREVGATIKAVWEVSITRPIPVLGEPEPIFSMEVQ